MVVRIEVKYRADHELYILDEFEISSYFKLLRYLAKKYPRKDWRGDDYGLYISHKVGESYFTLEGSVRRFEPI